MSTEISIAILRAMPGGSPSIQPMSTSNEIGPFVPVSKTEDTDAHLAVSSGVWTRSVACARTSYTSSCDANQRKSNGRCSLVLALDDWKY